MARLPLQSSSGQRPGLASRPSQPARPKTGGIRVLQSTAAPASAGGPSFAGASGRRNTQNPASQPADSVLYKRFFFPYAPDDFTPPRILITPYGRSSGSSGSSGPLAPLDTQLYNLLALICRGFITPWFSKISRDRAFLLEIVRVASHVFRVLESRLVDGLDEEKGIDKVKLLCESFPRVFQRHIKDFQTTRARCHSAYAAGASLGVDSDGSHITAFEAYFHSLQPHVAISATLSAGGAHSSRSDRCEEKLPAFVNADYLRAAIDALLRNLLPPEDYKAETVQSVVREVVLGIVLAGIFNKVSQPWFIYNLIGKILGSKGHRQSIEHPPAQEPNEKPSLVQRVSTFVIDLPVLFYRITALFASISLLVTTALASSYRGSKAKRNLARPSVALAFTFLRANGEGRQVVRQLQWAADTSTDIASPLSDKILVHFLYTRLFTGQTVDTLLKTVEQALFPGGYPAPSVPDPIEDEQIEIKARAYQAVKDALPDSLLVYLLPGLPVQEAKCRLAKDLLDPFSSQYCNIHLFMFVLDLVVANLCPELVVARDGA